MDNITNSNTAPQFVVASSPLDRQMIEQKTALAPSEPLHTFHDVGNVMFCSGVVCWDSKDGSKVMFHVKRSPCHKTEVLLPQAPCKWILKDVKRTGEGTTLESFDITADRIAAHDLGCVGHLKSYRCQASLQPDGVSQHSQFRQISPFLIDTSTSASGVFKVTAWFLAELKEYYGAHIRAISRNGEYWTVEQMLEDPERMPRHELDILHKAEVARQQMRDFEAAQGFI